jgi:hypothetical protein
MRHAHGSQQVLVQPHLFQTLGATIVVLDVIIIFCCCRELGRNLSHGAQYGSYRFTMSIGLFSHVPYQLLGRSWNVGIHQHHGWQTTRQVVQLRKRRSMIRRSLKQNGPSMSRNGIVNARGRSVEELFGIVGVLFNGLETG